MKTRIYQQPAIGIITTISAGAVKANGGLLTWVRHFESCTREEYGGLWLQKCRNRPQQDIAYVYMIVANRLAYRLYYGGWTDQPTTVWMHNGEERSFPWPHIRLSGPLEKAPTKITMRGFQGFRYVSEPLW